MWERYLWVWKSSWEQYAKYEMVREILESSWKVYKHKEKKTQNTKIMILPNLEA